LASQSYAAYDMENLDRGAVAVARSSGVFISWRWLGNEPDNVGFNVYRNGTLLNSSPLTDRTNYIDASGSTSSTYTVAAVVDGQVQTASTPISPWPDSAKRIALRRPAGGTTPDGAAYTYTPNDACVADLDGDGQYEIVLKWDPSNAKDNSKSGYTGNVYIDAYEFDGTFLWRIDLGRNIRAGAHYTQFIAYDLDSDGRAEVAMRTADASIDGQGRVIGSSSADHRNSKGYVLSGPEYLTIFEGGSGRALATTDFVPARGTVSSWGDKYGNRVDRFLAGLAWLDGEKPSLIMSRGYYTRAVVAAWDWRGGQLRSRWVFDTDNGYSEYRGQGAHSLTIGDVDGDGRQEIVFGAAAIDDDGTGLYSTGLGHGDALHLSDMDPNRHGLEVFMVHETPSAYGAHAIEMHDARSGALLWSARGGGGDIGRGVAMDIDPRYSGYEAWASRGDLWAADGQVISSSRPSQKNFGVYWDGDLGRELLDGTTIAKWDYERSSSSRLLTADHWGVSSNNGTKSTPSLSADILGDWREEVIWRADSGDALLMFTTTAESPHRLRTLMHDPQYRAAVAWQNVAYNQPPHPSYFLGYGMAEPPQPDLHLVGDDEPQPAARITLDTRIRNGSVELSWSAANVGIDVQWIYRDTDADPAGRMRIAGLKADSRSYVDTSVNAGGTYYYWVKATKTDGSSINSNASSVTLAGPSDTCLTIEEADLGFCYVDGTMDSEHRGFGGSGYANTVNTLGNSIGYAVYVPGSGNYQLVLRYANGGKGNRPARVVVDGNSAGELALPLTGAWTDYTDSTPFNVYLSEGNHLLDFISTVSDALPNVDSLKVNGDAPQMGDCSGTPSP
jgi:rhamnogalacturonan endolyase